MMEYHLLLLLFIGFVIGVLASPILLRLPWFGVTAYVLSKAKTKAIDSANGDGFILADAQGRIVHINQAVLKIFGHTKKELLDHNVTKLMFEKDADIHTKSLQAYLNGGLEKNIGKERQAQAKTKDGNAIVITISLTETNIFAKKYFTAFIRDITEQSEFNRQLQEQRNKFETLFEHCPDGIVYVDSQYNIIDVNRNFLTLYGGDSSSIINTDIRQLYHCDGPELKRIKRLWLSHRENSVEDEIIAKLNNKPHTMVLISSRQVRMSDTAITIFVFSDITEQLAQEEYLRQTKERLEKSQLFSNVGHWQWDVDTNQLYWSEVTSAIFGKPKQNRQLDFDDFISQIHSLDKLAVRTAIKRCIDHGEKYDIEYRIIWPDKSIRWLHQQGDVVRDETQVATSMIGVVQDVTERKNWESELHLFKQIIDSSNQIISVFDDSGYFIYANQAHKQQFEYHQPIEQFHTRDFLPLGFEASVQSLDIENNISQYGHWSGELQSRKADDSLFPAHVAFTQFHNKSDGRRYRFCIAYDITEERKQKQKLEQAKIDAELANRAKSEFLSNMSHELRTPLNAVLGFSQLLFRQQEVEFSQRINNNIKAIYNAGEHLLTLINGILELAKIESGKKETSLEEVNVKTVIDEAISLVIPQAHERGLNLQSPDQGELPVLYSHNAIPVVNADFTMLKQALLNYLSNAIKYNKDNGVVYITVDVDPQNHRTRISVCDSGIGIATEKLDTLFTPFNRLGLETSNIQGTGIGLAITKKNIECMEGTVGVTSTLGIGSSFYLELPYQFLQPYVQNDDPQDILGVPQNDPLVLYIEDDQSNIDLMREFFAELDDVQLVCVNSGELGLVYASKYRPQLILMDLCLPGMDGFCAFELIKNEESLQDCKIFAITADVLGNTRAKVTQKGFDGFISKPVELDAINKILREQGLIKAKNRPDHKQELT